MNRQNDLHPFLFEDSIHTGVVMACFDAFCHTITKKTVVVIDNAPIYTSEEFEDRIPYWKKKGLIIKYLPPYSPYPVNAREAASHTTSTPPAAHPTVARVAGDVNVALILVSS
jgi:hypothetical protein